MLSLRNRLRLLLDRPRAEVFCGYDPKSSTLTGPFPVMGDCVSEAETLASAYIDSLPIRPGDLGIWHMPRQSEGERFAAKWMIVDSRGQRWIACKFYATRYLPDFHKAAGRVVAILRGRTKASFRPEVSRRLAAEIAELRANPPDDPNTVVFTTDLLDQAEIICAIDAHSARWPIGKIRAWAAARRQ